jgi:hypothetical protein
LDGVAIEIFEGHQDRVVSAAFSPDGSMIITAGDDRTARLWNLFGEEIAVLAGHTDYITSAVFSLDGKRILTTSYDETARL